MGACVGGGISVRVNGCMYEWGDKCVRERVGECMGKRVRACVSESKAAQFSG